MESCKMADGEDETIPTSSFLFPSVVSQLPQNNQDNRQDSQGLSGFASFHECKNGENNSYEQREWNHKKKSKNEYQKKKKKRKKTSQKYSSESSASGTQKEYRKKKRKKKLKTQKSKIVPYDTSKPDTIWIENTTLAPENAFRLDKRYDKENLNYDSLYRLDIANYSRKSDIRCLGLKNSQSIEWTDQRSKKKTKQLKQSKFRYFENTEHKDLAADVLDWNSFPTVTTSEDGFVPMTLFSNAVTNEIGMTNMIRESSIELNREKQMQDPERDFCLRTEYFNKQLRDNPHDVDCWLKFVELQEKAFEYDNSESVLSTFNSGAVSSRGETAIREKKLDILEKALSKNPKSVPLILEYMRCYRAIKESTEIIKKWNEFTFKYPNKGPLWEEFLLHFPSNSSNFSIRSTMSLYYKCLSTLSSIADGTFKSHKPEKAYLENIVKIFLQYCFFLLQSDQQEKAIASLQALIEFNYFTPESIISMPTSGQKQFFEAFWDSEAPRFGDQNACGWKNWMSNQNASNKSISNTSEADLVHTLHSHSNDKSNKIETINRNLSRPKQWLDVEKQRIANFWKPWKQDEADEICEDPDRTVLADDVIPILFKVDNESSQIILLQLVISLLVLLGVPVQVEIFNQYVIKKLLSLDIVSKQVKVFTNSDPIEMIYVNETEICHSAQEFSLQLSDCKLSFIQRIFSQSLTLGMKLSPNFINTLSQCWLLFECILFKQNAHSFQTKEKKRKHFKKFAKSLLKLQANRNCIELWEVLAFHENDGGDQEEALRIFDMLIFMCNEKKEQGTLINPFCNVFSRYAMFLLRAIQQGSSLENKVINLLSLLSQDIPKTSNVITNEKMNPLRLRKIKSSFREIHSMLIDTISKQGTIDSEATKSPPAPDDNQLEWLLCYAVFEYFTSNITAANYVLNQLETDLILSQSQAFNVAKLRIDFHKSLLVMHRTKLSEYRKVIWSTVNRFPEDPILNQLLLDVENDCFTSLQVRRFFQTAMKDAKSINPFLFALKFELKRWKILREAYNGDSMNISGLESTESREIMTSLPSSGIANRLRGLFQRAVSSHYGQFCVTLWRKYIRFEVECGNLKRAKNIFYQSLQNCPWSKAIYLDAIDEFEDDFEEILDIMQEKEIRVRLPVEELEILLEDSMLEDQ